MALPRRLEERFKERVRHVVDALVVVRWIVVLTMQTPLFGLAPHRIVWASRRARLVFYRVAAWADKWLKRFVALARAAVLGNFVHGDEVGDLLLGDLTQVVRARLRALLTRQAAPGNGGVRAIPGISGSDGDQLLDIAPKAAALAA